MTLDREHELAVKLAGASERAKRAEEEVARISKDRRADVEAVRRVHHKREAELFDPQSGEWVDCCDRDGEAWPCITIRALDGAS